MKQKLLLILLVTFSTISAQEVTHVDFDTNNANIVFNSWNTSSTFAKVTNPAPDATNTSSFVGQFTAGNDNGIGIGVIDASSIFTSPFNLASNSIFKMKVFSTEEITIIFHLENDPDYGNNIEASASVSATDVNKWVELSFDFSSFSNIYMNNIVIKISGTNTVAGDIYFFDDIKGPELYTTPAQEYNPADSATDVSIATNLEIATNGKFRNLDDSEITDLTSKVALKMNNANGADVSFSASINDDKNKITIDPTNDLDNSVTYWYGVVDDSIEYSNDSAVTGVSASFTTKDAVTGDVEEMLFDFDTTNENVGFESWGGVGFAKIVNPDKSGINVSDNVAEYTYNGNDAGLENSLVNDSTPLIPFDFSETPFIKVKVWVSKPVGVSIKLQNYPDYGQGHEQKIEVTEINTWVEIVFNYGAITATNYDRVQIYFDKDGAGGSAIGDVYYFDEYLKSNIAPAVENTFNPLNGAADVAQFINPTISSNFQFRNLDDSTITDISSAVELRETDASGALVAMNAFLSDNKSIITIRPSTLLDVNTTYWYGIKDNTIEYKESDSPVNGVSSTFTTTSTAVNMVVYNDFDGTSLMSVSESMGDTPGAYNIVTDPTAGTNMVQQWDKGNTWGGWERIHFQLNTAFDASEDGIFSFRVYSTITTNFMLKLANAKEDGDQTALFEKYGDILVANEWQTVYVDASELAAGISMDHVFIFIGPGQGDVTGTFYVDDIMGPKLQGTASTNDFDKTSFQFFPNPANDMIRFRNLDGKKEIKIFDINSKQILKKTIETNELSIRSLKPGFYILEINGQFRKLIIE
ncbi:MAG: hypothetical protein ACJA1D_000559 [Polaribacter sp.]|jgi:hypothetical protein